MIILELACFGVRSFRRMTKVALKPGLNVIHGRTGSGKSTLFECLQVLLFGTEGDHGGLRAPTGASSSQAAVTVKLRNGAIYRVAKDFVDNRFHVLQWDASGKAFTSVASEPGALDRLWQSECDGLALDTIRSLVAWSPETGRPADNGASVPDLTYSAAPPVLTAEERAAKQQRLDELTASLAQAEGLARAADERTDARAREAAFRKRLETLSALQARREASNRLTSEMTPFLQAPPDIDALVDQYAKAIPALHEERTALEEEATELGRQIDALVARPLLRTPLFWAGAGLTTVSFLVAVFVTLRGWTQHLYLAGVGGGLALLIASLLLDFRRLAAKRRLETRRADVTRRASQLEDKLRKTHAVPVSVMSQTHCQDPETFKAKRRAALEWAAGQADLNREEAALSGGATREALEEEWRAARARSEALDRDAVQEVDLESLRDAIGLLTRELQAPNGAAATFVPQSAPEPDGWNPLGAHRTEINVCLKRLSEERLEALLPANGDVAVQRRGASDPASMATLSTGEAIQARLSIAIGAWVARRTSLGFPLLLDDPLAGLDPQSRRIVLDVLARLGRQRQILLFTNSPVPESDGIYQTALVSP